MATDVRILLLEPAKCPAVLHLPSINNVVQFKTMVIGEAAGVSCVRREDSEGVIRNRWRRTDEEEKE